MEIVESSWLIKEANNTAFKSVEERLGYLITNLFNLNYIDTDSYSEQSLTKGFARWGAMLLEDYQVSFKDVTLSVLVSYNGIIETIELLKK